MNRNEMIKWLSENTSREDWMGLRKISLPFGRGWNHKLHPDGYSYCVSEVGEQMITLKDVFCEPRSAFIDGGKYNINTGCPEVDINYNPYVYSASNDKFTNEKGCKWNTSDLRNESSVSATYVRDEPAIHDGSMTDYINNFRGWFKLNMKPDYWGLFAMPGNWNWSDDNHDMNTVIEHDNLNVKFNYSDIFGVGEMPPVKPAPILTPEALRERYIVKDDKGVPIEPELPPEKGKKLFVDGAKYKLFHDETNGLNDSGSIYTYEAMNDLFNGDDSINLWRGDAVRECKQGARVEYIQVNRHGLFTDEPIDKERVAEIHRAVLNGSMTVNDGRRNLGLDGLNLLTPEAISEEYVLTDDHCVPLTPGPIQSPDTDTLYWDKHNKKYCYIVGSAWDDGALFFAEEFVDGDVTGTYFPTERMNLVDGDKRTSILNIIDGERDRGNFATDNLSARIADRILSEVINCD